VTGGRLRRQWWCAFGALPPTSLPTTHTTYFRAPSLPALPPATPSTACLTSFPTTLGRAGYHATRTGGDWTLFLTPWYLAWRGDTRYRHYAPTRICGITCGRPRTCLYLTASNTAITLPGSALHANLLTSGMPPWRCARLCAELCLDAPSRWRTPRLLPTLALVTYPTRALRVGVSLSRVDVGAWTSAAFMHFVTAGSVHYPHHTAAPASTPLPTHPAPGLYGQRRPANRFRQNLHGCTLPAEILAYTPGTLPLPHPACPDFWPHHHVPPRTAAYLARFCLRCWPTATTTPPISCRRTAAALCLTHTSTIAYQHQRQHAPYNRTPLSASPYASPTMGSDGGGGRRRQTPLPSLPYQPSSISTGAHAGGLRFRFTTTWFASRCFRLSTSLTLQRYLPFLGNLALGDGVIAACRVATRVRGTLRRRCAGTPLAVR